MAIEHEAEASAPGSYGVLTNCNIAALRSVGFARSTDRERRLVGNMQDIPVGFLSVSAITEGIRE